MRIEYAGLGLFILIYVYVWVKNYDLTIYNVQVLHSNETKSAFMMPILNLMSMGWEILGTGLLIFLILIILVMTAFRTLAFLSLGIFVDPFSLRMAFGWASSVRLLITMVAGSVLTSVAILVFFAMSNLATSRVPEKRILAALRAIIVPGTQQTGTNIKAAIQETLIHLILMANMLIMSSALLFAYSQAGIAAATSTFSTMLNPSYGYNLAAYLKDLRQSSAAGRV